MKVISSESKELKSMRLLGSLYTYRPPEAPETLVASFGFIFPNQGLCLIHFVCRNADQSLAATTFPPPSGRCRDIGLEGLSILGRTEHHQ